MKVIFRVDSSIEMGAGHVMRCLTLAQILKSNGANVEFICRKHKGNLIHKLRSSGFVVHELEMFEETNVDTKLAHSQWLGATQNRDADDCKVILKAEKFNWLIVDHYALDERWQKRLRSNYEKLMVIDDLADRKHQCDILLDQTFGRKEEDYSLLTPKDCKLLLGSQYALLRPEFAKWRIYSLKRRINPEFKHLLINMGGVDANDYTGQVLDKLKTFTFPSNINITIVMGKSSPHLESVRIKASDLPYKTEVKIDVDNMAEIMSNSDISIGASGATTWERCCLGLPSIQIITANNQELIAKNLDRAGIVKVTSMGSLLTFLETIQHCMSDISANASKICAGTGASKVENYLQ